MTHQLEEVFNEATYPEVTFVRPGAYPHIKSSFKAAGKHITLSGPSGSGKTTLVTHLLRDLDISSSDVLMLNGRRYPDADSALHVFARELRSEPVFEEITELLQLVDFVIIDDFHHLSQGARLEIAQNLKLWHETGVRFIVIGIASSASELLGVDPEAGIRNDPFELKEQSDDFTRELIEKGEAGLNIEFSEKLREQIVRASNGVPAAIQVICKTCCVEAGIEETVPDTVIVDLELRDLREAVLRVFHGKYFRKVVGLAKGKRQARSVHNTYFDIIAAIAASESTEIPTEMLYRQIVGVISDRDSRKRKATSFYNCLNNLSDVIDEQGLSDTIHYAQGAQTISIEDPAFRFYLNLLDIDEVRGHVDIRSGEYPYDVAVSFSGDVRDEVEEFVREVKSLGLDVFYDFDQQAQLWGQDLREKLAQVYAQEAEYMVVFLSESYPERDWPEFEMSIGKDAARKRTKEYILPIVVDDVKVVGLHDSIGYVDLRSTSPGKAAKMLLEKIERDSAATEVGRLNSD